MNTKQDSKKNKKVEIGLDPEEHHEVQMILDRLRVQDPRGESLQSYLQSLRKALLGRENLTAALIGRLSRDPSPAGFKAFLALRDIIRKKEYKRTVKKAAYRFGQKGYAEDADSSVESKIVLIPKETRQAVAHMIPAPDVDWFVAAFFPAESSSEPVAISVYTENRFTALSVRVVESSQKLYKEFIQKLTRHLPDNHPFDIPAWHAARIFFEMIQFNGEKGVPTEAERAKRFFRPFYDPDKPPWAYQFFAAVEHPLERLGEIDVEAVLGGMPFLSLLLPEKDLSPYFHKLQDLERSVLVVRPEIQQERSMDLLKKAADELFVEKTRYYYQRLFEEHALALGELKKVETAQQAWIVAQHLASSARVSENPVMTQIVLLSMQSHWPDEFSDEEGSEEPYRETESGLIVPG